MRLYVSDKRVCDSCVCEVKAVVDNDQQNIVGHESWSAGSTPEKKRKALQFEDCGFDS